MKLLLTLLLSACTSMHVAAPSLRDRAAERLAVMLIEVDCDPFGGADPFAQWAPSRVGTATAISEDRAITAGHVVACAGIPTIHATLADGSVHRLIVEREDRERDVALLELAYGGGFGLGLAPALPLLGSLSVLDRLCVATRGNPTCGMVSGGDAGQIIFDAPTRPGDSGAGVYDDIGSFVGVVISGSGRSTATSLVDPSWLR